MARWRDPRVIILTAQRVCPGCASWILPGDPWDTDTGRCLNCPETVAQLTGEG